MRVRVCMHACEDRSSVLSKNRTVHVGWWRVTQHFSNLGFRDRFMILEIMCADLNKKKETQSS